MIKHMLTLLLSAVILSSCSTETQRYYIKNNLDEDLILKAYDNVNGNQSEEFNLLKNDRLLIYELSSRDGQRLVDISPSNALNGFFDIPRADSIVFIFQSGRAYSTILDNTINSLNIYYDVNWEMTETDKNVRDWVFQITQEHKDAAQ